MPRQLLIVRHQSSLRVTSAAEVLRAFSDSDLRLPRADIEIDTRPLEESVEGGHWRSSDEFVRKAATDLRSVSKDGAAEIHFFGIGEVPHVIGIGAHFGDETLVHVHDYDRDRDTWTWPAASSPLAVEIIGLPREEVAQSGEVTLVIEISYAIDQHDVDRAVGTDLLSAIRIQAAPEPSPGIVGSPSDVMSARQAVREALAAVARYRPGASVIHLFIAAPMSVCFAVGQELRLRNSTDVMTYRYRRGDPTEVYKRAILLTARPLPRASRAVREEERAVAAHIRPIFAEALSDIKAHARLIGDARPWYDGFEQHDLLQEIAPFATLISLRAVVHDDDELSLSPRAEDYAFVKDHPRRWEISDGLLLAFYDTAKGNDTQLRTLARLFFYHEYLHDWQDLTKYTAEDVGSFPNCLEAIDYMADSYAFLHQLDRAMRVEGLAAAEAQHFLVDQISLAIASFWAFEPVAPNMEWQERRIRRYLNWYWRRVQLRSAPDLRVALRTLSRRPAIEIAGFKYRTGSGRQFVLVNEPRPGDTPAIGVVLEDGRFDRRGSTRDLSITALMRAFGEGDREAIDRFFNSLFEHLRATGGVFPT